MADSAQIMTAKDQEILDCIEEDAEDAIKASIANITDGVKTTLYKVEKI